MLVELLYCSVSVAHQITNVDLERILDSARRRNLEAGITGVLLYYRGEFVQILEGEKESIENVYEKFIGPDLRPPSSAIGISLNTLTEEAKSKPLSLGLNAFVSIYNQMRKSPYR